VTVLFADGLPDVFNNLPEPVKRHAARSIDLLASQPRMYPIRRRGLMRGYRYFVIDDYLFYYSVTSAEVRISAIIPGRMRRA
jgi:plasmid stabilization system protein ParE